MSDKFRTFDAEPVRDAWVRVVEQANLLRDAVEAKQKAERAIARLELKLRQARSDYQKLEAAMLASVGLPSRDAFNEQAPSQIADDDCDCDRPVKRDC